MRLVGIFIDQKPRINPVRAVRYQPSVGCGIIARQFPRAAPDIAALRVQETELNGAKEARSVGVVGRGVGNPAVIPTKRVTTEEATSL